jgi:hypothetical protein
MSGHTTSVRYIIPVLAFASGIAVAPRFHAPREANPAQSASPTLPEAKDAGRYSPHGGGPSRAPVERADAVLATLLATPSDDLVGIASGVGRLTALPDTEAAKGYQSLDTRPRRRDYIGSLVAAYLWSRVASGDPATPLPQGWDLEQFPGLLPQAGANRDLGRLRELIIAGQPVSYEERRWFFNESLREDPIGTLGIWLKNFSGENQLDEMAWFRRVMESPTSRSAALNTLMGAGLAHGDITGVIDRLSAEWMLADPAGYEKWLNEPRLSPYRESLLKLYASRRCENDPAEAWHLSAMLPENVRMAAQLRGSRNLAETDPQLGIRHLADIAEPEARLPLVRAFGENLAIYHYEDWVKWRDGLPQQEQDAVNQSSFETWVARDVEAALAWLQTRPNDAEKAAMIAETSSRFARQEPEAVAEWIRTLPDPDARLGAVIAGIRSMPPDAYEDVRKLLDAAR